MCLSASQALELELVEGIRTTQAAQTKLEQAEHVPWPVAFVDL